MRYVGVRMMQLVVVLLVVTFLTFLLINLLPNGPETVVSFGATEEQVEEFREQYNLNDPIPVRYVSWLGNAATGDLGDSYVKNLPVVELMGQRLTPTLQLMFYAQVLALAIALPLGILTAFRADSLFDKVANTTAFGLLSVPNFILAVLLVYFFSIQLGWLPATYNRNATFSEDPVEHFKTFLLPAFSLAAGQIAIYMRLLRTDMIATLQEDYIGVAKAKGMPTRTILMRHALRPSSFSLLTIAAINIGQLIGGTIVVERIFSIPGIGSLIVESIFQRDYLVVQGTVVLIAVAFVLINFAVDIFYAVLDPRIRHARAIA